MKKIVLKLDLPDDKAKQKAMRTVSTLSGIDFIAMNMKEKKLTLIGAVDVVNIVSKLRKHWPTTEILLVGPAKEPEKPAAQKKKEDPKKAEAAKQEEGRKEEPKKEGGAGGGGEQLQRKEEPQKKVEGEAKKEERGYDGKKKLEEKKAMVVPAAGVYDPVVEMVKAYKAYNPQMTTYYHVQSMEENPSACTIC